MLEPPPTDTVYDRRGRSKICDDTNDSTTSTILIGIGLPQQFREGQPLSHTPDALVLALRLTQIPQYSSGVTSIKCQGCTGIVQ
uniref:Uncharacterized protein n=1 Tax=Hyaloperonospora arabidopsidis (strain Emoy2) TaxID=559515 RepID=M4BFK7_HYAAE